MDVTLNPKSVTSLIMSTTAIDYVISVCKELEQQKYGLVTRSNEE